jgi:hypothetical protein
MQMLQRLGLNDTPMASTTDLWLVVSSQLIG